MELSEHTKQFCAIAKVERARELLIEAYGLWPTYEIRLSRERVDDALDEIRELKRWQDMPITDLTYPT